MKKLFLFIIAWGWMISFIHADNVTVSGGPAIPKEYTYSPDSLALYIDAHYNNDDDKLQALYDWITHNMSYNIYITFSSRNEAPNEDREVRQALRKREGVCRQFALLFQRVGNQLCIPVFMVNGYTRSSNSISPYPHSWCIAKIGSEWFCYDPTYDMGYIENEKFVHAPQRNYYRMAPQTFVRNHMPFDPIFQALSQPVSYDAFDSGKSAKSVRPTINFNDSIRTYSIQSQLEQLRHSVCRVKANGTPNRLIDYYLELSEANLKVFIANQVRLTFNESMRLQNLADDNKRELARKIKSGFKDMSDDQIKSLMDRCEKNISQSDKLLKGVKEIPDMYKNNFLLLQEYIDSTHKGIMQLNEIGSKYLAMSPSKRKSYIRQYMP